MEYDEDAYLMLSGIQHFQYCKRQWALIHIEQQWEENVRTIEGQDLHRKADQPFLREKRGSKLVVRGMPVKSEVLKITGVCDVVEFISDPDGIELNGLEGKYLPYPIEYKRGKPKKNDADILQLTAQAICLEEMLLCSIKKGYMYYDEIRHRISVDITNEIKDKVKNTVREMYDYYKRNHTPKVKSGNFCKNCSLNDICMPNLMSKRSVKNYIDGRINEE